MQSLTEAVKHWIHWCHGDQAAVFGEAAADAMARMAALSPYSQPILTAEAGSGDAICRGYAVACQGAVGYLGRLRCNATGEMRSELLAQVASDLCHQSLGKGVEMVQAILPANETDPWTIRISQAFQRAGMTHAARLLQLECCDVPLKHDGSPLALDFFPLQFHPFTEMPWDRWCQLVEETYVATLDVPILNGVRSVEQTLQGYAVGNGLEASLPWWSVHVEGAAIGCLILTPLPGFDCELTYLGLIPSARGHRYSPEIMDFVSRWMVEHHKSRIILAVDSKNAPALHLYSSFGFEEIAALDAWFMGQRTVAAY
jgi:ribosomal protein S18 acetylase RimI-like enzyme